MSTTQQKLEWQKRYAREAARIQNLSLIHI